MREKKLGDTWLLCSTLGYFILVFDGARRMSGRTCAFYLMGDKTIKNKGASLRSEDAPVVSVCYFLPPVTSRIIP